MIVLDVSLSDIPASARRTGKNGKVYASIVVDNLKQPDNYGNTHTVYMSQSKEEKAAKVDKVYIGKAKEFIFNNTKPFTASKPAYPDDNGSDLPF